MVIGVIHCLQRRNWVCGRIGHPIVRLFMRSMRPNALMLLVLGLVFGLSSGASAQITFTETGTGGCFVNLGVTECAKATFSLMTRGTGGAPGSVFAGTSTSNVTGLQIVIQNTTPTTLTTYTNADLLTGFFWSLTNSPTLATTTTGGVTSYNGSAIATNSKGGQAIINPNQCSTVAVCTGTSINVGAYWAGHYNSGGWSGTPGTFAGAYSVATSGYGLLGAAPGFTAGTYGHGNIIGANDPALLPTKNSLDFALLGGAGSTPTTGNKPAIQDIVTIQVAFASPLTFLNLNTDILAPNIHFAYGTNPDSASGARKAPEPASIALFGVGVLALGLAHRLKRRNRPSEARKPF
jgi:hypothetical protein